MIVVDVETGGLNPTLNPLLSIGAVDYDNPMNRFYGMCHPRSRFLIEESALEINGLKKEDLLKHPTSTKELLESFFAWVNSTSREYKMLAGENPSFDRDFIDINARLSGLVSPFGHRTVDLHTLAYTKLYAKINADGIYKRLGMPEEPRPHHAMNGALWEAEAFSRILQQKSIIEQFSDIPIKNLI